MPATESSADASFIDARGRARAPRTDSERRMATAQAEAQAALAADACPVCGRSVRLNLAITGWVQCLQFGAVGFRVDAGSPPCSWQGFTR